MFQYKSVRVEKNCADKQTSPPNSILEKKRKFLSTEGDGGSKRKSSKSTPKTVNYPQEDWVLAAIESQQRLRKLRRERQRRYRKKQDNRMLTLEEETNRIRQEIEKLEQHRRNLSPSVRARANMWSAVGAYFHVCRNAKSTSFEEQDFVQATMTSDVVFNGGCGTKALIEEMRRFSSSFEDFELELLFLKKDTENSLVATTTTTFTLSKQTLQKVFPHLWSSENGGRPRSPLADKLVGQRIVVPGTIRFTWDETKCRMTSVLSRTDLVTPMLELVGSLENLAQVFEHKRVFG
ncbi:hypothetical protein PHMEG_00011438 [Phytophthora megakarya]|uniref:Bzip transcription factor n=1 Tax=Phytophthora megakarya TaxID=4795 RepID=A0A225WCN1_9STRA|nr:hypothetical protein PHMEG_00011438 [Phytophthora megakarya]